jgi:hypothetical protein
MVGRVYNYEVFEIDGICYTQESKLNVVSSLNVCNPRRGYDEYRVLQHIMGTTTYNQLMCSAAPTDDETSRFHKTPASVGNCVYAFHNYLI